jgi:hypothetical protein
MSKLILDEALREKLNGLESTVEVYTEADQPVGYFVPRDEYLKLFYAWANAQVTDEELERADQEPGGRTLAEIWKSLGRTE